MKRSLFQKYILLCLLNVFSLLLSAQIPTPFTVTGSGSYCVGSGGLAVGLDNSQADVLYTLYRDGTAQPDPVPGSGSSISFGNQLFGTYTVIGVNGDGTSGMNGSAVIIENPIPPAPSGSAIQTFCSGALPTVTNLTVTGTGIRWYDALTGGNLLTSSAALVNGSHYFASQTVDGCESNLRLDVTAVVNTTPPAPTGVSSQTFCSGALPTVTNLAVTGTGIRWYDALTGGNLLASSTALVNGSHYFASQTVDGCESNLRLDITAIVNTTPSAPAGSAIQTFCSGALPTVTNLAATGTGIRWYDALTGGNLLASSTALVNGSHYFASQTVDGCESNLRLDITAIVNTTPSAPAGSAIQTFCSGALPTVTNLAATGTGIRWYDALTGGNLLASSTALVNGTHYFASQTVDGCESNLRLDVTAIVNTTPSAPAGSATQTFCSGALPTVTNLTVTGTGIRWYDALTGGNLLTSSAALVNGSHYFASQTVDGCESNLRLDVTAVVNTTPPAPTGISTQTFCSGALPTVTNLAATGTGIRWYDALTGGNLLASSTALVNGSHYFASQTVDGCESNLRLDVTAIVNTTPSAPAGSAIQTFCSGALPTVTNIAATGTGIRWYDALTGGNLLTSSTALVNGSHYFASQTVDGCESNLRLDITAIVNTTPSAPAGSATQTFCSGALPTVTNLTVTGTGIRWYDALTGGNLLTSSAALVNGSHYFASQTVDGCESNLRLDVTAVVNTTPPAPTGISTQTFCSGALPTVTNLAATGTSIRWYDALTGGNLLASSTALVNGSHYFASQTVDGCESNLRLDVTAVVNTTPPAPTGVSSQTFCSGALPTVTNLTVTGTGIRWYDALTGGNLLTSSAALVNGSHYFAGQTVDGCESNLRLDVTAVVNTTPPAPTGISTQTFCSGALPTVTNLAATGTSIRWYDALTGGNLLASSTALVNGSHYFASQTVNGCESSSRLNITAVVNITPVIPNQTTAILTGTTFTITPEGAGVPAGTTYTWTAPVYIGGVTGGSAQTVPQPNITGTLSIPSGAGTASYTVTPSNGSCPGASFTVIVIVTSTCVSATISSQPADRNMCMISGTSSFTIGVNGTTPVVYQWQYNDSGTWRNVSNGTPSGASYTGSTGATLGVSGITQAGSRQYRCLVSNCGIATSIASNPATLTVDPLPSAPTIGSVLHPTCINPTGTINISAPTGTGFTYSINGTNYTNTTGVFSNVSAGNYTVTARSASGCISPTTAVTVNAQPATPPAPTVTLVQPTCNTPTGSVTVTAPTGIGMTYSINNTTYTNTTGVFTAVTSGTYTVTARNTAGCTSAGTIVNIQAQPLIPTVTVTNPAAVCSPSTVNITAPAVTTGSTSNLTYTYWTNAAATATYSTPTTASSGTYYIKGTTSAGCYDVAPVIVTVLQTPTANAGTGGNECDLNFQLNAISSAGTGTWTMTSGPGAASFSPNENTPNAIVTVSVYGTYTFRWTEVNGICSGSNSITVNFYQQPVANAGTGGNNCGLQFNLNGSMNVGTGVWTRVSGTGTVLFSPSDTSPNAIVTVPGFGAYRFRWTVTNGTCSNSSDVNVTFVQQPAANAGSGGEECDLDHILNATPGITGGKWSKISGPGDAIFSNISSYNATVSVSKTGTYEFAWTIENSSCSSIDFITVVFHELPQISAGPDTVICEDGSAQLHASGNGSFIWEPSASLSNPALVNPVATPVTTTVYSVTLTDQNGCKNKDDVKVEVLTKPVADAGSDIILEYLFKTSLDATASDNGSGTWSLITGSGIFKDATEENTEITGLSPGINEFRWTVTNGVCPVVSDDVTVTVKNLEIPTLITPDHGDDYNEYFIIRGIETLGKTSLIIFDRRGVKVYENNNYNNDWNGVDYNNKDLPEDTYFYNIKSENVKPVSGFIVIKR